MIKYEIQLADKARGPLQGIANGSLMISHLHTDRTTPPQDHEQWMITVRTNLNHRVEMWMEGRVVHKVTEFIDPDGRRLIGDHNKVNVLGFLDGTTNSALTKAVMDAFTQVIAT